MTTPQSFRLIIGAPVLTELRRASTGRPRRAGGNPIVVVITPRRAPGDQDFTLRERRLLNILHAELGRLIRGPLDSALDPNVTQLSPRLRQTLDCLLEGDSEKQVAARLGLSTTTVHQYVTALYRHFRVQSRSQLMARVLQRIPRSQAT